MAPSLAMQLLGLRQATAGDPSRCQRMGLSCPARVGFLFVCLEHTRDEGLGLDCPRKRRHRPESSLL